MSTDCVDLPPSGPLDISASRRVTSRSRDRLARAGGRVSDNAAPPNWACLPGWRHALDPASQCTRGAIRHRQGLRMPASAMGQRERGQRQDLVPSPVSLVRSKPPLLNGVSRRGVELPSSACGLRVGHLHRRARFSPPSVAVPVAVRIPRRHSYIVASPPRPIVLPIGIFRRYVAPRSLCPSIRVRLPGDTLSVPFHSLRTLPLA